MGGGGGGVEVCMCVCIYRINVYLHQGLGTLGFSCFGA